MTRSISKCQLALLILLLPVAYLWTQVLFPSASHMIGRLFSRGALPSYYLRLSPGQPTTQPPSQPSDGLGADTVVRLDRDATLQILIQPDERVAGETSAAAFLVQKGRATAWPIGLTRAASGAFSLRAPVRTLPGLSVGQWDVVFVVGRSSRLLDSPLHALGGQEELRLLFGHLDIVESNSP